jgi:hypothetical protein
MLTLPRDNYFMHVPLLCPSKSPPYPSHIGLSLLAALQRDGLGWSRPRRSAHSQIQDQWMPDDFTLVLFIVEHSSKVFLLSIDWSYLF